jgi:molybdopterin molybdotransferase
MSELGPSPLSNGDDQLSVESARAAIARALQPITETETLPLTAALGRVLGADIVSPISVPAHDNSAMDGYALRGTDLLADADTVLTVAGTVHAGDVPDFALAAGQCVRIMTGAVMPAGLDTVVPQELCTAADGVVRIRPGALRPGDNRRLQGEDLRAGHPALTTGQRLRPADLGLIASLGIGEVTVMRRLRVALFSTGNELRTLGQPLDAGCIYDSNRYSLMGALARLDVEIIDLGLVRDDPAALAATLDEAIARADVVLTSGGVSVGDADYTKDLLASRGDVAFWKVAMRPGRPFAFGPLHRGEGQPPAWLFALPGNPVAALVTFYAFARDGLLQLAGARPSPLPTLRARCTTAIRKRPGRTEFQRAIASPGTDGQWEVRLTGTQGAGVLRSMSEANALVVLGHAQTSVAAGDAVNVWLFDGLV